MNTNKNDLCQTVATIATVTEVAFHVVQTVGGNEVTLPDSRDIIEDIAREAKVQIDEMGA